MEGGRRKRYRAQNLFFFLLCLILLIDLSLSTGSDRLRSYQPSNGEASYLAAPGVEPDRSINPYYNPDTNRRYGFAFLLLPRNLKNRLIDDHYYWADRHRRMAVGVSRMERATSIGPESCTAIGTPITIPRTFDCHLHRTRRA